MGRMVGRRCKSARRHTDLTEGTDELSPEVVLRLAQISDLRWMGT